MTCRMLLQSAQYKQLQITLPQCSTQGYLSRSGHLVIAPTPKVSIDTVLKSEFVS